MLYYKLKQQLLLATTAILLVAYSACKKDDKVSDKPPVITGLRAIAPAPNDSVLTKALPGQTVVLQGTGLKGTTNVYFNGFPTEFNSTYATDNHLVITIPSNLPFGVLLPSDLNKIRVVTTGGETTFAFPVVPPPPVLFTISYELAEPGQTITLTGQYLYLITKIVFPGGIEATEFAGSPDGTTATVKVPNGATSPGRIVITNQGGIGNAVSAASWHDLTGTFQNFDNIGEYSWGATSKTNSSPDFPDNHGQFVINRFENVPEGNRNWWEGGRSINSNPEMPIMPVSELSNPLTDYALKFEIFVKEEWTGGSAVLRFSKNEYEYLYRPWYIDQTTTKTFKTSGWETVTVPLNKFSKGGNFTTNLAQLLGNEGKGNFVVWLVADKGGFTKFNAAFDNFRIVKMK